MISFVDMNLKLFRIRQSFLWFGQIRNMLELGQFLIPDPLVPATFCKIGLPAVYEVGKKGVSPLYYVLTS